MAAAKGLGKIKAALGALAGLFGGAAIMYVSPLVDRVVKPGAPVANFEARQDGLTVTFHNLSTGSRSLEGWWDFGDGSPLVPLMVDQDVTHTFPRPGGYSVKLTVRNLLGDTNERGVTLQLEPGGASDTPRILSLNAVPLTPEAHAPATFKVSTEVQNAALTVWDLDEDRPLEVFPPSPGRQERFVTFEKPGGYVIKLAAFNGQQHEQKAINVNVRPAPAGALTAILSVNDKATRVERADRRHNFSANFPPEHKGNTYPFKLTFTPTPGWTIGDVIIPGTKGNGPSMKGQPVLALDAALLKAGPVRNLQILRDSDGKKIQVTGELTRNSDKDRPAMVLPVIVREERRQAASRIALPVMASLPLPGSTSLVLPPLPQGWESPDRAIRLELREGNRTLWQGSKLPRGEVMSLRNRRFIVNANQNGERVDLTLSESR